MSELRICHLWPDVLNLYGDRGNVLCIKKRLEWRGIGCTVTELPIGERRGLGNFDLFFVGGGQDFEQGLLLEDLRGGKGADIRAAAERIRGAVLRTPTHENPAVNRAAGTARNPRTGETVARAASKTARFRVGEGLKTALNG